MVDEHLGIQMIELVLHDTCQIAIDPFVVLLEVLIHVLHMNASVARHILVDAGQRQASFLQRLRGRLLIDFHDVRIDIHVAETLVLGEFVTEHVEIDNSQTDVLSDLRGCEPYSIRSREGFKHIGNQLCEARVVGGDIFRLLAQHWLPIYINR